jgi:predicted ArsR family transcriptional regulator
MARDPLARTTDDESAVGEVVQLLDGQGFEPEARGREIHMHRCPFHALAEAQPEVVCAVHKGLMSGALSALGSDLEVEGLDVFVRPDLCVARLS